MSSQQGLGDVSAAAAAAGASAVTPKAAPAAPAPAPHAPEAGWGRRLLGRFHVTGVFWYRFHGKGVAVIPSRLLWVTVYFFTTIFGVALPKIRGAVAGNLEAVLGRCGWWRRQVRIYRTLRNFAWCLTERYERLVTTRSFRVDTAERQGWEELCAGGGGFILVTAHLGSWEVGSMLPGVASGRTVHVVREPEGDPRAQQYISELMRQNDKGSKLVTHFADDPQLGMLLLDALRCGEIVALQCDRPRAGGKTAVVSLFGKPFPLPMGPAILARAAGVPIIPVFVFRCGRRHYSCVLRPPIVVDSTTDRAADLDQGLRRVAAELERAIARRPYQWFCFRRLWPD